MDTNTLKPVLLDFGLTKKVSEDKRFYFSKLLVSAAEQGSVEGDEGVFIVDSSVSNVLYVNLNKQNYKYLILLVSLLLYLLLPIFLPFPLTFFLDYLPLSLSPLLIDIVGLLDSLEGVGLRLRPDVPFDAQLLAKYFFR